MILKVLKAMFTSNEAKLPDHWPVEANIAKEGEEIIPPWLQMTLEELEQLKEAHRAEYDSWLARLKVKEKDEKEKEDEKKPIRTCKEKLLELGFTEEECQCLLRWREKHG